MPVIARILAAVHAFLYPPRGSHAIARVPVPVPAPRCPETAADPIRVPDQIPWTRLAPPWLGITAPDATGARRFVALTPQQWMQAREACVALSPRRPRRVPGGVADP